MTVFTRMTSSFGVAQLSMKRVGIPERCRHRWKTEPPRRLKTEPPG